MPISGIIGACLTPFTADGKVDLRALEREIEFVLPDVGAVALAAVEASEYTMLSVAERKELWRIGAELVAGRAPLIIGVSAPTIDEVVSLSEDAAECGADVVHILMPARPWGGEPSREELLEYFGRIGSASSVPLLAYHNPTTGADPDVDTWIALSELQAVAYFKDSSRDATKIGRLVEEIEQAGNAGYFTTMQPLLMTLLLGGSGATMPPPATRLGARIVRAVAEGDRAGARYWQRVFSIFPSVWGQHGLPPVMKAAARHFGLELGEPKPPYRSLSAENAARLDRFLTATGARSGDPVSDDAFRAAVAALR